MILPLKKYDRFLEKSGSFEEMRQFLGGNVLVTLGNVAVPCGNVAVPWEDVAVPCGNVVVS